jgi:hypothetical protein
MRNQISLATLGAACLFATGAMADPTVAPQPAPPVAVVPQPVAAQAPSPAISTPAADAAAAPVSAAPAGSSSIPVNVTGVLLSIDGPLNKALALACKGPAPGSIVVPDGVFAVTTLALPVSCAVEAHDATLIIGNQLAWRIRGSLERVPLQ